MIKEKEVKEDPTGLMFYIYDRLSTFVQRQSGKKILCPNFVTTIICTPNFNDIFQADSKLFHSAVKGGVLQAYLKSDFTVLYDGKDENDPDSVAGTISEIREAMKSVFQLADGISPKVSPEAGEISSEDSPETGEISPEDSPEAERKNSYCKYTPEAERIIDYYSDTLFNLVFKDIPYDDLFGLLKEDFENILRYSFEDCIRSYDQSEKQNEYNASCLRAFIEYKLSVFQSYSLESIKDTFGEIIYLCMHYVICGEFPPFFRINDLINYQYQLKEYSTVMSRVLTENSRTGYAVTCKLAEEKNIIAIFSLAIKELNGLNSQHIKHPDKAYKYMLQILDINRLSPLAVWGKAYIEYNYWFKKHKDSDDNSDDSYKIEELGQDTRTQEERLVQIFTDASNSAFWGCGAAYNLMGMIAEEEIKTNINLCQPLTYYVKAANLGYAPANNNLARLYLNQGDKNKYLFYVGKSANEYGDPWALSRIGQYYVAADDAKVKTDNVDLNKGFMCFYDSLQTDIYRNQWIENRYCILNYILCSDKFSTCDSIKATFSEEKGQESATKFFVECCKEFIEATANNEKYKTIRNTTEKNLQAKGIHLFDSKDLHEEINLRLNELYK